MKNIRSGNLFLFLVDNLIWVLVIIALVSFSALSPYFFTAFNLVNILLRVAALGLLVIGQSFTLITANFDLSSESTMGLTAMIAAMLIASSDRGGLGWMISPFLAIPIMLLIGVFIGWINGILITKFKMNNFIVTVAMLFFLRGAIYGIHPGESVSFLPESFNWLGGGSLFKLNLGSGGRPVAVPVAAFFLILSFIVAHIVTRYRRFGRDMYALGSNRAAAEASGINASKIILGVYIISGLCAALAGLLEAGRLDSATPRTGYGLIFPVQAAAVIGGISLFGDNPVASLLGLFRTPWVILGLACYALSSVLWLDVLSKLDFSLAFPLVSLTYVFQLVIGRFIFHEVVGWDRVVGVLLILGGLFFVVRSGR